jgi:pantothenate kinase
VFDGVVSMDSRLKVQPQFLPGIAPQYIQRIKGLLASGQRVILGLVGAPGAGKSTLAQALLVAFEGVSQVVPMDGFHLSNVELARLGRSQRKGAPDTFDSAGYVALLARLRHPVSDEVVYAPEFRREIEEPIAGVLPIFPTTQLLIAEGNYLLLAEGHWAKIAQLVDETWYVDVEQELRTSRLIQRHEEFGRSHEAAKLWVANTDEPNARLIAHSRERADLVFHWDNM